MLASTEAEETTDGSNDATDDAAKPTEFHIDVNTYSHAPILVTEVCVWVRIRIGQSDKAGCHERSRDLHGEGREEMS